MRASITTDSPSSEASGGHAIRKPPTLWGFMRGHGRASAAVIALLLAAVLLTVVTAVASSGTNATALADSSTCSQWTAAPQALQRAYSRVYIQENSESGILTPPTVTSAIDAACTKAAYLGESDDISVVAAVKQEF